MTTKTTAKDFFVYLAGFAGLYVSAISLLSLLFAIINRVLPDILNTYSSYSYVDNFYSGPIRAAIASLIVIFPLYLFLAAYIDRYLHANPEKKELAVRKWLTYLTLFLTGVAVVIDLVVLVNTFLGGEITARFIWKVISVFVVSGSVFGYYFYDLRKTFVARSPKTTISIISAASILVIGSLVWGFVTVGSPMKARATRIDERRVGDLTNIQWQIINYWQQKGSLPTDLETLNDPISGFAVPVDPETNKAYRYEKVSATSFTLCADFTTASPGNVETGGSRAYPVSAMNPNWNHASGTVCFDRLIDRDLYPVREAATVKGV